MTTRYGGVNSNGLVWHYDFPDELIGVFSINLLEFIAVAITIYLTIKVEDGPQKLFSFTDSSSALGWLYKASFNSHPLHDAAARWLAKCMIEDDAALYLHHIRGIHNIIADMLSRNGHLPDNQLIHIFNLFFPTQTPKILYLVPLPTEITSWILSLSASLIKMQDLPPRPSRNKLGVLTNGIDSW